MQKYVQYIFALFTVACIAACGGSGTTTTPTFVYDHPTTLAPSNTHMGGAVQGGTISTKVSNYSVSTFTGIAGSAGFSNYSTINGPPATFNHPTGITTDGTTFYVADYGTNFIRKVTSSGTVTTLQCTTDGTTSIGFNRPTSLTIKADGSQLYVVDSGSNTIRIIDIATNKVTTVGATDGSGGSVDSTDKTAARFNQPTGITTDGDNLYVTDSGNQTIRRIDLKNNYAVSTLAGTSGSVGSSDGIQSAARFNLPARITTDRTSLYVTDFNNRTIRKIDILTGTVTTIAGTSGPLSSDDGTADGTGTAAHFNQPNGITTDGTNLYVTDSYTNTIRKVVISTGEVTTLSGIAGITGHVDTADGTPPSFDTPVGITTDGTSFFVADSYNNTIRKIQ